MKRREPGTEWSVTPRSDGFAVGRSSEPWAVFTCQAHACLAAAILPQAEEGLVYRLIPRDDSKLPGFDVVTEDARAVGWLREYSPETIEALHVIERIAGSPAALASLLEAVNPEVLETTWRIVALRRRSRR